MPGALVISANVPAERIARRLSAASRIRTLHGTVLRRMETLASHGEPLPELPTDDALDEATVLVAGRGRNYPELAVAVGERVGLVGALSVESAARALNARDIDGMIIGDGFGPRIIEALLTVLAEDVRFRDLPVAVLGGHPGVVEEFLPQLANLDRLTGGPARLLERFLPFVRVHAFGERLKRMLKSLDAKGMIDPHTGLLAHDAFWRDLNRAVGDAEKRGVGLSIARFSFARGDRRISLDAARLVSRLMRQVDFACREADDFDLCRLHRDRSACRPRDSPADRKRAQAHHAGVGSQQKRGRHGGDAGNTQADRQRRFAHRPRCGRGCRRLRSAPCTADELWETSFPVGPLNRLRSARRQTPTCRSDIPR